MNRRFILALLSILCLPLILGAGVDGITVNYLKSKAQSSWPVMALAANGVFIQDLGYIEAEIDSADTAIDMEAGLLALFSQNRDISQGILKLLSFFDGTQLGSSSLLNDDIFGLLILSTQKSLSPDNSQKIMKIRDFVAKTQSDDGGWSINAGGPSDSNMTSMALIALKESGYLESLVFDKGLEYLRRSQGSDGGFRYTPEDEFKAGSDANSTAWAISAIRKLGVDPATWKKAGGNPISYLEKLKRSDGTYAYSEGAPQDTFTPVLTAYAAIALSESNYPVKLSETALNEKVDLRVEVKKEDDSHSPPPNYASGGGGGAVSAIVLPVLAFEIDAQSLDFKDLKPGQSSSKVFTVSNKGTSGLDLYSRVEGDDVFINYLNMDSVPARSFSFQLNAGLNKSIEASLSLPGDFSNFGLKSGSLVIFATPQR